MFLIIISPPHHFLAFLVLEFGYNSKTKDLKNDLKNRTILMKISHSLLYFDNISEILNKIKARRVIKGYGKEYMGGLVELDYSGYVNIENGRSPLKIHMLLKIAEILEMDIENLFTFENITSQIKPGIKKHDVHHINIRIEFPFKDLKQLLDVL